MSADERGAPPAPVKGRGALRNVRGRFEPFERVPFDDGWDDPDDEAPPPLRTMVSIERARTILTRNDSPDVPFEVSINPYGGCEHGCSYCFARPTHAFLDLSPGLDFETRLVARPNAPALLREALRRKGYVPAPIAIGTNTDPYQPVEGKQRITRGILEVLAEHRHPVSIVTKSHRVLRDVDLLAPMARDGLANVFVSITTLEPRLARNMEPRAATPARRLATLARLHDAGIPTGVLASPMIPGLNDHELEKILEAAAATGAAAAGYILLRLPHELRELFTEWLEAHYPDRAAKVLNRLREMHGGRLYDPRWGRRMKGEGRQAELLRDRFALACRRLGLNGDRRRMRLDTSKFRVPPRRGDQQALFS